MGDAMKSGRLEIVEINIDRPNLGEPYKSYRTAGIPKYGHTFNIAVRMDDIYVDGQLGTLNVMGLHPTIGFPVPLIIYGMRYYSMNIDDDELQKIVDAVKEVRKQRFEEMKRDGIPR